MTSVRTRYFVGIDLHKSMAYVYVLDGSGQRVKEFKTTFCTLEGGLGLVGLLEHWKEGGRFVVEALGLNRWFVNACQQRGLAITVANPNKLGLRNSGKKTDRRDAYELARRLRLGDIDRDASTYYPPDEQYSIRRLLRTRHVLVEQRQRLVNQLRGMMNSYYLESPGSQLYSARSIAKLRTLTFPQSHLQLVFHELIDLLERFQRTIDTLTKEIRKCEDQPSVKRLCEEVSSVGPQTAVTLVHELGDLTRFDDAKAVASYAGLAPKVCNSADRQHHGKIHKKGNPHLRWILGQAAVRLMNHDERAKQWAQARLKRMHKNKVRTALARRLLVGIFLALRRNEPFSLEKCLRAA